MRACSTASRYNDVIDLYFNQGSSFSHYYACPGTGWAFETSKTQLPCANTSKISMVRYENYIDIFMVDAGGNLLRYSSNPETNWAYVGGVIMGGVNPYINIACARFSDRIHVVCVGYDGRLIHLEAGFHTGWEYISRTIRESGAISALCGVSCGDFVFDIYFIEGGTLVHGSSLASNGWQYNLHEIAWDSFKPMITCTRFEDSINIYCVDAAGTINHYFTNSQIEWAYQFGGKIYTGLPPVEADLTALQFHSSLDVFYYSQGRAHRLYSESDGNWIKPVQIDAQVASGVSACRCQWNISVFFLGDRNVPKHAYLTSDNGWSCFQTSELLPTIDKPILNWEEIQSQCKYIGSGHFGNAYKMESLNLIIKTVKNPIFSEIKREVAMLDQVSSIYPNMCQYQVHQQGKLVGFSMKFFQGKSWSTLLNQEDSIFQRFAIPRVVLVMKLAQEIIKIQNVGVCHGDFSLGNLLIHVTSQDRDNPKMQPVMIDFGLSFPFGPSNAWLSWPLLTPPQCWNKPYNPVGVNAYQFGRVALQILLGYTFSQYGKNNKVLDSPNQELEVLSSKFRNDYPGDLIQIIGRLLSTDIQTRIDALYYMATQKQNIYRRTLQKRQVRIPRPKVHHIRTGEILADYNGDINQISKWRRRQRPTQQQKNFVVDIMKSTIANILSNVPTAGPLMGAIASFIFADSTDIDFLDKLIGHRIEEEVIRHSKNILKGIRQTVKQFYDTYTQVKNNSLKAKKSQFREEKNQLKTLWLSLNTLMINQIPKLKDQRYGAALFPSFVFVANLHLMHLLLGWEKQNEWNLVKIRTQKFGERIAEYYQYAVTTSRKIQQQWNEKAPKEKPNMGQKKYVCRCRYCNGHHKRQYQKDLKQYEQSQFERQLLQELKELCQIWEKVRIDVVARQFKEFLGNAVNGRHK